MTSSNDIYIQRCRVAAKYLFRYRNSLKISLANNLYYDLYVEDSSNGLSFGVKVVSPNYENSEEFKQEYLPILKTIDPKNLSTLLPIAILSLNEANETGKCGVILSIGLSRISINYPPTMREINDDNFSNIMNDIIASDRVIRSLDDDTYGVIKTITVKLPDYRSGVHNANFWGQIIYKRSFDRNYKMNPPAIIDEKEQFNRLINGIPQSEYPSDVLDSLIFDALKQKYTEVEVENSLLLFSSELRNLKQQYYYKLKKKITIQITPNIDTNTMALLGGIIECPQIHLTLYVDNTSFRYYLNDELILQSIDPKDWASVYQTTTRLKQTLTDLSKIIN